MCKEQLEKQCISQEQAIDKLVETGWLKEHDEAISDFEYLRGFKIGLHSAGADIFIAKKPILQTTDGFDSEVASEAVCPNCHKPIVNVWSNIKYNPNFCHYCGQKFDWSDDCIKPKES